MVLIPGARVSCRVALPAFFFGSVLADFDGMARFLSGVTGDAVAPPAARGPAVVVEQKRSAERHTTPGTRHTSVPVRGCGAGVRCGGAGF
ncbi:hypothetical protein Axi01nite_33110 [Actinoplanes xinjiangensis]|nr:hypothetical protein Axi01nite_33110 [Actinoplanes xinjiangensis]